MFLKSLNEKNMTLLIKRKLLTCVNISTLYLAIAKRLNILLPWLLTQNIKPQISHKTKALKVYLYISIIVLIYHERR